MTGDTGVFTELLVLLGASVALVVLLHRFHAPYLLAFLLVGLACGPTGLGIVGSVEHIQSLAEFGVVFLLFTLGLEFSLPRLIALRGTVFGIGSLQVGVCGAAFFLVLWLAGLGVAASFVIAGGLALSSTAIVSRELVATGQVATRHGQVAIGILLFQDIVAVFLLILLPVLAHTHAHPDGLGASLLAPLLKGVLLFLGMLAAGRWVLPRLLDAAAGTRAQELFMMTALLVALFAAWVTSLAGLSMALGAFLAGMVLGESRYRHQVEADIRPFRDLLIGLFFVSVGLTVDLDMLLTYWPRILAFGLLLVLFKFTLVFLMTRALGEADDIAIRTSLALAQGGEFFFALLALAARERLLPNDVASFLVAVTVTSMVFTPLLIRESEFIAGWLGPRLPFRHPPKPASPDISHLQATTEGLHGHVVILGFGRVGQTIARFLRQQGIPWIALDTDVVVVREASTAGDPVYFGDPVRSDILHAAGAGRAALVVVSFDHLPSALRILGHVRDMRPDVPILVRTRDDRGLAELQAAGATEVIPETLEAGLMLVSHVFTLLRVPPRRVEHLLQQARQQRYRILHGYVQGEDTIAVGGDEESRAVALPAASFAVARTLASLRLDETGASVVAVRRGAGHHPAPPPDFRLEPGDVVLLVGTAEAMAAAEDRLLGG